MPRSAHSAASSRVSASTAARAAPVCAIAGMPWCGETVTLTTVPPSLAEAGADRGAGHRVGAVDVQAPDGAPALRRDLLGGHEVLAAGVVDEHVEAPVALARGLDDPRRVGRARGRRRRRTCSARRSRRGGLEDLLAAPGDDDVRPGGDELDRGLLAEVGAAAGDEHDAPGERVGGVDLRGPGRQGRAGEPGIEPGFTVLETVRITDKLTPPAAES